MMVWPFLLLISSLQVILIGAVILLENRAPGKTVGWLCILGFLPVLGFILYVIFGRKTEGHLLRYKHISDYQLAKEVCRQTVCHHGDMSSQHTDAHHKLVRLLLNSGFAPLTHHNRVEILLNGGEKFQALFNALEGAKHHIHLSYYIYKDDEIGADVLKILARKVVEGVEVRVLLDGMGSISLSGGFISSMRQAGIQAEWFFPIRFPFLTA